MTMPQQTDAQREQSDAKYRLILELVSHAAQNIYGAGSPNIDALVTETKAQLDKKIKAGVDLNDVDLKQLKNKSVAAQVPALEAEKDQDRAKDIDFF